MGKGYVVLVVHFIQADNLTTALEDEYSLNTAWVTLKGKMYFCLGLFLSYKGSLYERKEQHVCSGQKRHVIVINKQDRRTRLIARSFWDH